MEKEMCDLVHKNIDERLDEHDDLFKRYGEDITLLKIGQSKFETQITNLCEQIKSLVTAIKGIGMLLISTLLAFFVWYIQSIPR